MSSLQARIGVFLYYSIVYSTSNITYRVPLQSTPCELDETLHMPVSPVRKPHTERATQCRKINSANTNQASNKTTRSNSYPFCSCHLSRLHCPHNNVRTFNWFNCQLVYYYRGVQKEASDLRRDYSRNVTILKDERSSLRRFHVVTVQEDPAHYNNARLAINQQIMCKQQHASLLRKSRRTCGTRR